MDDVWFCRKFTGCREFLAENVADVRLHRRVLYRDGIHLVLYVRMKIRWLSAQNFTRENSKWD